MLIFSLASDIYYQSYFLTILESGNQPQLPVTRENNDTVQHSMKLILTYHIFYYDGFMGYNPLII